MTNLFGHRAFKTVVREVLEERFNGKATYDDPLQGVKSTLTMAEHELWHDRAFRQAVIAASKTSVAQRGADAAYGNGEEVVVLRHFSVEQFEDKARELVRGAKGDLEAVRMMAKVCYEIHGKTFDAEAVIADGLTS